MSLFKFFFLLTNNNMFFNIADFQKFCRYSFVNEKKEHTNTTLFEEENINKEKKPIFKESKKFKRSIIHQKGTALYTIYEDPNEDEDEDEKI